MFEGDEAAYRIETETRAPNLAFEQNRMHKTVYAGSSETIHAVVDRIPSIIQLLLLAAARMLGSL